LAQDLAGGSFLTTSIFLAACLLVTGLIALTLRRPGDRPIEDVEATAPPAPSGLRTDRRPYLRQPLMSWLMRNDPQPALLQAAHQA